MDQCWGAGSSELLAALGSDGSEMLRAQSSGLLAAVGSDGSECWGLEAELLAAVGSDGQSVEGQKLRTTGCCRIRWVRVLGSDGSEC